MKRDYFLSALLGVALVAFTSVSRAQDATPSPSVSASDTSSGNQGGSQGNYLQKLIEMLGLSDAQVAQIKTILQTSEGQSKTILGDSSLTQDQKSTQISALKTTTSQQVESVFTPEQQQQFKTLLQQFQQHHWQKR